MSTHLVVGATGGIGRAAVKALAARGESVRVLVRDRNKAERYLKGLNPVEVIEGDAGSVDVVRQATLGAASLFYCVNIPYPRWAQDARRLLAVSIEAASAAKATLVFPGNVYVFGHAQTKLVGEEHPLAAHTRKGQIRIAMEGMLKEAAGNHGLGYTIVRFPDFYGPYIVNGFTEQLMVNALKGKPLRWIGDLDAPYDAILSDDAGEALVTAGLSEKAVGKSFHVPGPAMTTARQLLAEIVRQSGKQSKISTYSAQSLSLIGLFSPLVREVKEMLYLKQERFIMSGARYAATFGAYPATPYTEGITKSLAWAEGFYKESKNNE